MKKLPDQTQAIDEFLEGFANVIEQPQRYHKVIFLYFIVNLQYRVCNICLNSSIIIFITYKNLCLDSVGAFVLALYSQMMMKGNFV